MGGLYTDSALIPTRPVRGRARPRPNTSPHVPPVGATLYEFDGGVEGHARAVGVRHRLVPEKRATRNKRVSSRYQARPVDTYSSRTAVIRSRDGFPAYSKKGGPGRTDASLFTCVDWDSPSQPRTLGTGVKHGSEGSTRCGPC